MYKQINLLSPWLVFGVILFPINLFADAYFNIPIAEIIVVSLMLFQLWKSPPSKEKSQDVLLILSVFLVSLNSWLLIAGVQIEANFGDIVRSMVKLSLIPLPPLLYLILRNKLPLLCILVGFLVGYGIFYTSAVILSLLEYGYILRNIRQGTPSPALWLFLVIFMQPFFSTFLKNCFLSFGLLVVISSIIIDVRAALLAVPVAAIFAVWAYSIKPWKFPVYLPLLIFPALPALSFLYFPMLQYAYESAYTLSNIERLYLLEYSLDMISFSPWYGNSMEIFSIDFAEYFNEITEWVAAATGPHNLYLDLSIAYGLPIASLFIILFFGLSKLALAKSALGSPAAAWGISVIMMHCTFFGYTSIRRFEIMLIWFALFFMFRGYNDLANNR